MFHTAVLIAMSMIAAVDIGIRAASVRRVVRQRRAQGKDPGEALQTFLLISHVTLLGVALVAILKG